MVQLRPALVDFADALKTLVNSQSDVTELVTKWDDLVNTTTPKTVKIVLSDGTEHLVDNLAKIRNDLVEGLSLDKPTISELKFQPKYGISGGLKATEYIGATVYRPEGSTSSGPREDPFDKHDGYAGFVRALRNDFFTVCQPTKAATSFDLLDLPRVMALGVPDERNNYATINIYNFAVTAPSASRLASHELINGQYGGMVTLLNSYTDKSGTLLGPVTVNFIYSTNGDTKTYVIQQKTSITLLLWANPGMNIVNIAKIGEGQIE